MPLYTYKAVSPDGRMVFGRIDAIHVGMSSTAVGGLANQRDVYWSVEAPMGMNVSATPFRPGDVARIERNGLGDGQVLHFMRQEQFNIALGLPPGNPIDVDAIAFHPNFGVFFSIDTDVFCPMLCGGTLVRDGDILCVPPGALALTPDLRVAAVIPATAEVAYNEAQVDMMVMAASVADRFGACVPNAIDLEALEFDFTGPVVMIPTCTGVALVVRRCVVDYLAPARLDDLLDVETRVVAVRGATLDLRQTVRRDARDLVRIEVRLVAMTRDGRPTRIPASVRAVLAGNPTPDTPNASNHQDRGMDHHG